MAALALSLGAAAQCVAAGTTGNAAVSSSELRAQVTSLALGGIAPDHVRLLLTLTLVADHDATVSQIGFFGLRVNGLPVYSDGAAGPLRLQSGQPAGLGAPLPVDVYYRDLDTLEPLRQLLRDGVARVEGAVVLQAKLNPLEKLLLASGTVRVEARFQNQVPVAVPGPAWLRPASLASLETADRLWKAAAAGGRAALAWTSSRRRQLLQTYAPALLRVRTEFTLGDGHGGTQAYACSGAGVRLDARTFLVPKQTLQPWKFDPGLAVAIAHDHWRPLPGAYNVTVWMAQAPAGQPGWSEARGEISLLRFAPEVTTSAFVPHGSGRPVRVKLEDAAAVGNAALMQWAVAPAGDAAPRSSTALPAAGAELASFRLGDPGTPPQLIFLTAAGGADRLTLPQPLDASAWGAPLIAADGIAGVVLSERAGVSLSAVLRALQWPPE